MKKPPPRILPFTVKKEPPRPQPDPPKPGGLTIGVHVTVERPGEPHDDGL